MRGWRELVGRDGPTQSAPSFGALLPRTSVGYNALSMSKEDFRLPRTVWPRLYCLYVEADLERWSYRARETIELDLQRGGPDVVLHSIGHCFEYVAAFFQGRMWNGVAQHDPERETVTLRFERPLPAGPVRLELHFTGTILDRLRGFYRSQREGRRYAATQFEAADARRAFPCFDEPEFKARFQLTLVVPPGNQAIANAPEVSRRTLEDGRIEIRLAETPPISSYLVAWCIGPFESTAVAFTPSGVPVRVWLPQGMSDKGEFAREAHVRSLAYLEQYTNIPYPYAKVDAIGLPDFEAGAMENPGAITYRLTAIAADPKRSSVAARKAIFSTVAHELTHMWWGDLVTMVWWEDLWLNESFATFVGTKVSAELMPEWGMWRDFVASLHRPFQLDALRSTHPISFEVRNAKQATERFDVITYWKGAAVVRMIENFLGADAFRSGVQAYLQRFRERNAQAEDFWRELSEASGQDVAALAQAWIKQPGHPLLTLQVQPQHDGLRVEVQQGRFFADPEAGRFEPAQTWAVPLVCKFGTSEGIREERHLLTSPSGEVFLPGAQWLYPNGGASGFYRFLLDDRGLQALVPRVQDVLAEHERLNLLDNQWTLLKAGRLSLRAYFALLEGFRSERDRAVLGTWAEQLGWLWFHALPAEEEQRFGRYVEALFRPHWQTVGWNPGVNESDDDRMRRAILLSLLGNLARAADLRAEAAERIRRYFAEPGVLDPNLVGAAAGVAARDGDAQLFEQYLERKRASSADPEEEHRFLMALASFEKPELVQRTLSLVLTDEVRPQDRPFLLNALLGRRWSRLPAWEFVRQRWDELARLLDPMLLQNLVRGLAQLTAPELAEHVLTFLRDHATEETRETTAQACEQLRLDAAAVRRLAGEFGAALRELCD